MSNKSEDKPVAAINVCLVCLQRREDHVKHEGRSIAYHIFHDRC